MVFSTSIERECDSTEEDMATSGSEMESDLESEPEESYRNRAARFDRLEWECDICFSTCRSSEASWQLQDERCYHTFCKHCLRGCIEHCDSKCPHDGGAISAIEQCGVLDTSAYVSHEQRREWLRVGGIRCPVEFCPGLAPSHPSNEISMVACTTCRALLCGRSICGAPWTEGHRCADIIEEEAVRAREDEERVREAARRAAQAREQARAVPAWTHDRSGSMSDTHQRLAEAPRFRICPGCGAMAEHDGGCNMVLHSDCGTRWCFICLRVGTCSDYNCRASPDSVVSRVPRRIAGIELADAIGSARAPRSSLVQDLPRRCLAGCASGLFLVIAIWRERGMRR